jgi:thiosulfate reductase cytochrome b subunit
LAYALDQFNPVLGSAVPVAQLTGLTVLAEVGTAFPTLARLTSRRELRQVSIAIVCLLAVFLIGLSLSGAGLRLDIPALQHMVGTWV